MRAFRNVAEIRLWSGVFRSGVFRKRVFRSGVFCKGVLELTRTCSSLRAKTKIPGQRRGVLLEKSRIVGPPRWPYESELLDLSPAIASKFAIGEVCVCAPTPHLRVKLPWSNLGMIASRKYFILTNILNDFPKQRIFIWLPKGGLTWPLP